MCLCKLTDYLPEQKGLDNGLERFDFSIVKGDVCSISTDSTELKAEPLVETKNSDSLFIDPNDFKYSNLKEIGTLGKWIKN